MTLRFCENGTDTAMHRALMLAIISCAAALADTAHSRVPEQEPAQSPQASVNPPAAHSGSQEKKPDPSDLEESIRRVRARGDAAEDPATRYPGKMPKVIRSDRNSFHPPANHGKADPTIPADTRTRQE